MTKKYTIRYSTTQGFACESNPEDKVVSLEEKDEYKKVLNEAYRTAHEIHDCYTFTIYDHQEKVNRHYSAFNGQEITT